MHVGMVRQRRPIGAKDERKKESENHRERQRAKCTDGGWTLNSKP